MPEAKVIARSKHELRELVTSVENRELLYDSPKREIDAILQKQNLDEDDLPGISLNLGIMGYWLVRTGALAILDGNPAGWTEFHFGMTLKALDLRGYYVAAMRRPVNERQSFFATHGTLGLIHAMAIGDVKLANELADLVTQGVGHGFYGPEHDCGFEPFVINLFQVSRGDSARNIGFGEPLHGDRYKGVWTHWNSVDDLGRDCVTLCDWHYKVATQEDPNDEWIGQFGLQSFEIYPVEILALQRIRKKLGLPVPTCDHDLMKGPLAEAPTEPPLLTDDLADRVRKRLKAVYEGF